MTEQTDLPRTAVRESTTAQRRQDEPARRDRSSPVAIEDFDREHMGIAAKE